MLRKILAAGLALATTTSLPAQNAQKDASALYRDQCKFLLQHKGQWITENAAYKEKDSAAPRYFAYEFSKGVNDHTVQVTCSGYNAANPGWHTIWQGYYTWNAARKKVTFNALYADGSLASGESESVGENIMVFVNTITSPGGKIEKIKESVKIMPGRLMTRHFASKNNQQTAAGDRTWQLLEPPKASLTFMSTRDGNFEIYSMGPEGENLKNLSCHKATDYAFSYFPGTARLVFYTNRDGNDEIYIQEADGRKLTNITNHPSSDRIPYVSPDGKQILFISDRDHKSGEIYRMDADGKNLARLTHNEYFEDAACFSYDGKKIYFTRELRDLKDTSSRAAGNGEIFVMNTDGTGEKQLTNRPGYDGGPQLSPDGKKIAFYGKSAGGNYDLFIMNPDGSGLIQLTNDKTEDYSPSWSPDGKWIAFTRGDSGNYDVWVIHLETRILKRLTTQVRRDESPIWQPVF